MKTIFNKKIRVYSLSVMLISVLLGGVFMQSCDSEFEDINTNLYDTNINLDQTKEIDSHNWKAQLEKIMNTPSDILVKSGIELLGYEIISSDIDNSVDENRYKNAIKSDENMIPFYSNDLKSIKAITKKEMTLRSSQNQKFTTEEGDNFLDNINLKGAKIIKLKWNNKGVETNTICAVSDKNGIVYDNFITNLMVIKEPTVVINIEGGNNNVTEKNIPRLKSSTEGSNFSGSVEWSFTTGANWLWGSERGNVTITHTGYYINGNFSYHNFTASHYFNIGNSDAKVSQISNNTVAYGYGFSTPYITINITLTGSNYSVSFSTTIGSSFGGNGQHTHPLNK